MARACSQHGASPAPADLVLSCVMHCQSLLASIVVGTDVACYQLLCVLRAFCADDFSIR